MSINSDDNLKEDFNGPNSGDHLFKDAEDWQMNACINWCHDPTELYIIGYKLAPDLLVESVATRNRSADSLIYPIVFLYRHYLELRLKSILHDGNIILSRDCIEKPNHSLSKTWRRVRVILLEIWPDVNTSELDVMESLIKQFDEVDPNSTSFRYPKDFYDNNLLKLDIPRVNLRNLAEVINEISVILDGVKIELSEYKQMLLEMQDNDFPL